MLIYEVNLDLDASIEREFRAWLTRHVSEILAIDGFLDARIFDVRDPVPKGGRLQICCQYQLQDQQALDHYIEVHSNRMRADGLRRFPGQFNATRRVLLPATPRNN